MILTARFRGPTDEHSVMVHVADDGAVEFLMDDRTIAFVYPTGREVHYLGSHDRELVVPGGDHAA